MSRSSSAMNPHWGDDQAIADDDSGFMVFQSVILIETFILSGVASASLLLVREVRNSR